MYVSPAYSLETLGRGRFSDRNATQIPDGGARDSLNLLHNVGRIRAKVRRKVNRLWKARPGTPGNGTLAQHELVRSDDTSAILTKIGTALYATSHSGGLVLTSILSGMHATHQAAIVTMGNRAIIADRAANYISNATSAETFALQKTAPNGTVAGASGGVATGNVAASITYWITDIETTTGMECPPSASAGKKITVSRSLNQGVNLSGLTYDATYLRKAIYRTTAGDPQPYYVGLVNSPTTTYADTSLDSDLTTTSTVHDEFGVPSIEKPEAARHATVFRSRVVLGDLEGHRSRIRWSRLYEGTQYENYTWARRDIDPNDGDFITGIVTFKGSLVIFKQRSIHVMNGDVDDKNFAVYPMVRGIGARAARSIVVTDDAIYFLSECAGVYALRTLSDPPARVGAAIDGDTAQLEWPLADQFCAGFDICERQYLISATPAGATANTKTHVLNVETGAWGRYEFSTGIVMPKSYGSIRNADGEVKLHVGDANGYAYEFGTTATADGIGSGTVSGVVTSSASTVTATIATAAFFATDDGLKGLSATLVTAAGLVETREISSNTGSQVTVSSAWSVTIVGSTLYIGAIQATLSLNRVDLSYHGQKSITQIEVELEKQTHTTPLQIGYSIDGDTPPTTVHDRTMSRYNTSVPVHKTCTGISLYFNILGVDVDFELLRVRMPYRPLGRRLPSR